MKWQYDKQTTIYLGAAAAGVIVAALGLYLLLPGETPQPVAFDNGGVSDESINVDTDQTAVAQDEDRPIGPQAEHWAKLLDDPTPMMTSTPVPVAGRGFVGGELPPVRERTLPVAQDDTQQGDNTLPSVPSLTTMSNSGTAPLGTRSPGPLDPAPLIIELPDPPASTSTSDRAAPLATGTLVVRSGSYTIRPGDTFSSIAAEQYGNGNLYWLIEKANPGVNPRRIQPGMTIQLPPRKDAPSAAATSVKPVRQALANQPSELPLSPLEHRVSEDENLSRIARSLYGEEAVWTEIHELNRDTLGNDPNRLKVGQVLKLPRPKNQ